MYKHTHTTNEINIQTNKCEGKEKKNIKTGQPGMLAHTYNPNTQEIEARGISRPALLYFEINVTLRSKAKNTKD